MGEIFFFISPTTSHKTIELKLNEIFIGEVELEVTQIGKKCHGDGCAIFSQVGKCVMPKEGVFCRVLSGGTALFGRAAQDLETLRAALIAPALQRGDVLEAELRDLKGEGGGSPAEGRRL